MGARRLATTSGPRAKLDRAHSGAAQISLCAKGLATALTTSAQNLTAARCCLAGEETVATSAHEIAWLECPLHIVLEIKMCDTAVLA